MLLAKVFLVMCVCFGFAASSYVIVYYYTIPTKTFTYPMFFEFRYAGCPALVLFLVSQTKLTTHPPTGVHHGVTAGNMTVWLFLRLPWFPFSPPRLGGHQHSWQPGQPHQTSNTFSSQTSHMT